MDASGREIPSGAEDPSSMVAVLLQSGALVAIKGLGGYHLACDPFKAEAAT